jgi:hypothetical protein
MDSAILTALAGVWESLVGGSATGHATLGRIRSLLRRPLGEAKYRCAHVDDPYDDLANSSRQPATDRSASALAQGFRRTRSNPMLNCCYDIVPMATQHPSLEYRPVLSRRP